MKAALLFLGLITLTTAQLLSVSAQVPVTASGSASAQVASFTSSTNNNPLTAALPSFSVTANDSATLSFVLALNLLSQPLNFAGGLSLSASGSASGSAVNIFANVNFASNIGGLFGALSNALSQFISLSITSTNVNPVKITLTGTTGSLAASGSAGANVQVGLFTVFSDQTAAASGGANAGIAGAVPYSIAADGKTYTYTVIVPGSGSVAGGIGLYMKPFDANQAKSANNGATASSTGSASFSTAGFIPVALGYDQALTGGLQYAFGNNLQVTPSASSGSQGTLNVQNVGGFSSVAGSSGNSAAPSAVNGAANGGAYFNNYYQISGSGSSSNVLQWSSTPSDPSWNSASFTNVSALVNGGQNFNNVTGASLAAQAQAKGQAFSWYKSSTNAGASAAANTWTRVSSTSTASASGGIKVYATVNSYSQWTVASGNGNVVHATLVTFVIALLVILF